MKIKIETKIKSIELDVNEQDTISNVMGRVIETFDFEKQDKLKYCYCTLGKQNSVFMEFGESYTLKECNIKDGDTLVFSEYGDN